MAYLVKNNEGTIYVSDVGGNILTVKASALIHEPLPQLSEVIGFKKRYFLNTSGKIMQQRVLHFMQATKNNPWSRLLQLTDTSVLVVDGGKRIHYISQNVPVHIPVFIPEKTGNEFTLGNRLFVTGPGRKIYGADGGLKNFEPVKLLSTDGADISLDSSNFLLYWDNGMSNPILFSGSNAWLLHYRNTRLEAELICTSVPSYSFIRFAQYSQKNKTLFIGTDSKGIILIGRNRLLQVKKTDTDIRERNAYYSQVALPGGNILTNEGHILGDNAQAAKPLPINGKFSYTVHQSGDSLLWYAQWNKQYNRNLLHSYHYPTKQTTVYSRIVPIQENFAIAGSGNQVYIATSLGMGLFRGDSISYLFSSGPPSKTASPPYSMLEFSPGVFGVASCDGVLLHDINKKSTDTLLKIFGYCFRTLWRYKEYVFIGSYGKGFYIWKNGKLKAMPLDKNKFLLYTHCFVADDQGYCWISSNRGLFKVQLSDLTDAFENNRPAIYYHYFGKNDGMEITEMNGGCSPCALVMQNKNISFPTMDGLLWIDPEKAKPLLPQGNIYVDELIAGNKKINPDSLNLEPLPAKANNIFLKLGFSSWCNKENIYLEYQLNNDSAWRTVDVNNGAFISLNNLEPGAYRLLVRKLNGFGINNYSYKEIRFSISTPWTRQWWFFALCGLALLGLIALYLQWRTRQYKVRQKKLEKQVREKTRELQIKNAILEKNDIIKTRLISIISHDIVTPLKFVTVAGKNLLEKKTLMTEDLKDETIREMTNTSQELQLLSTNILNWIKYQHENRRMVKEYLQLAELVNQVFGVLHSLAKQKNISLVNKVSSELKVYQYFEPLKILIYNLLTNAIHFSEKGSVIISVRNQTVQTVIEVTDEGVGMTAEQIKNIMADQFIISSANIDNRKGNGLGYLIIKDLVKMMAATLQIESEKGKGTIVSISFKAEKKSTMQNSGI